MKTIDIVAAVLLVVGGLNWGLAVFDFNLVNALFGAIPVVEKAVYALVGLAALYQAVSLKSIQHRWGVTAHAHSH